MPSLSFSVTSLASNHLREKLTDRFGEKFLLKNTLFLLIDQVKVLKREWCDLYRSLEYAYVLIQPVLQVW